MHKSSKIYIAGHRGLVGSSLVRLLQQRGFKNLLIRTSKELDLTNQLKVQQFFKLEKPDYVILAAAKVGGIYANNTYPAEFIYQNLMIECNVIHEAYKAGVERLLFLGSTCIYPKSVSQPMQEQALLTDVLESTNEPYAIAKIAGIKMCESYNRQYKTDYRSVMPTNLYGSFDNFNLENSHVIPALIRKFHLAKLASENDWSTIEKDQRVFGEIPEKYLIELQAIANKEQEATVTVWGTGKPMREFLHVDDMAAASLFVLELDAETYKLNTQEMLSHINVGTGIDQSIDEIAETIKNVVGFNGELVFDANKPDGSKRKLIDVTRIHNMGWRHQMELHQGLDLTYQWYKDQLI